MSALADLLRFMKRCKWLWIAPLALLLLLLGFVVFLAAVPAAAPFKYILF